MHVTVQLGIIDLIAKGICRVEDIAATINCNTDALKRLLQTLVSFDILQEADDGLFALCSLGSLLRADISNSLREAALMWCHPVMYEPWTNLLQSVRTNRPSFDEQFGTSFFNYQQQNVTFNDTFNRGMATASRHEELTSLYDFGRATCVTDVGGGYGKFLALLLRKYSHLKGVLYDLPVVAEGASRVLTEAGIMERVQIIGGDMFESVPSGSDIIVLSHVLMDCDDVKSVQLLQNCRTALVTGARLLIVDVVLSTDKHQSTGRLSDLTMLILTGGRHRTNRQYCLLIEQAGFMLESSVSMQTVDNLLICVAV